MGLGGDSLAAAKALDDEQVVAGISGKINRHLA